MTSSPSKSSFSDSPGDNAQLISSYIQNSVDCITTTLTDKKFQENILRIGAKISDVISSGGKILIAGNGGSSSDSQHFACELVSRFLVESNPYAAISLSTDTSAITAIANDYGYEHIFSRQLNAIASPNDLFIAITTSGKSRNILEALNEANKLGLATCSMTGSQGLAEPAFSNINIQALSTSTPHIQELHGIAIHLICALVESNLSSNNPIT